MHTLPAGDKQSTLMSMFVFCMQHGMLWAGNPILPEQHAGVAPDEAANRLGAWSGLMARPITRQRPMPSPRATSGRYGCSASISAETLHRVGATAQTRMEMEVCA